MRSWPVHSAGVDWITATATDPLVRTRLHRAATHLLDAERDDDNTPRAWHWKGYAGWQCGAVVAGEREDSYFSQVSGGAASLYWLTLADAGARITRLDLQVTALTKRKGWDEASHQWERIEANGNLRRRAGWRQRVTTKPAGATLYIGSPKSERRLRLYDKHAEDPEHYPVGAWRWELQTRAGLAGSIAASLADRDRIDLACVDTVHQCYRARGVQPGFRAGSGGVLGHVPRARTDAERTLRWLEAYVRPTVARLSARGYGSAIRRSLGVG